MAITERVEMNPNLAIHAMPPLQNDSFLPGLRIMARTTSSSLSDYPEWDLEKSLGHHGVVTDGACS